MSATTHNRIVRALLRYRNAQPGIRFVISRHLSALRVLRSVA